MKKGAPKAAQHDFPEVERAVIAACAAVFENEVRTTLRDKERSRETGISGRIGHAVRIAS